MSGATASAVIPVKNGRRYLGELLSALEQEGVDEILVIDSGSDDGSVQIARRSGATVLEIPPDAFGHGRTRNLGAERTSGELICFLTQDATPIPGWLDAYREAFAMAPRVGAAYGPHLPRPDASPMIAPRTRGVLRVHFPRRCFCDSANGRPDLPLECQRVLLTGLLGRSALSRRRLR